MLPVISALTQKSKGRWAVLDTSVNLIMGMGPQALEATQTQQIIHIIAVVKKVTFCAVSPVLLLPLPPALQSSVGLGQRFHNVSANVPTVMWMHVFLSHKSEHL